MSNHLARILDIPEASLHRLSAQLESWSGYPSEDTRLISDLIVQGCHQVASLGLDPRDTTAKELYQALLVTYDQTSQTLARAIGEGAKDDLPTRFSRIEKILESIEMGEVWAIKKPAIRKLLLLNPPRRVMKHLGYRSPASMLKREDPLELYAAGRYLESARWQKLFSRSAGGLAEHDFEVRPPQTVVLSPRFWEGVNTKRPLVTTQPEAATVVIWPNSLATSTPTLGVLALSLRAIDDLHAWSAAIDGFSLQPRLPQLACKVWSGSWPAVLKIAGQPLPWRSVCHHYRARPLGDDQAELSMSLWVEADRLSPVGLGHSLAGLHIALSWWAGSEALLFADSSGRVVSLNLIDVAVNQALRLGYSKRRLSEGRQCVMDELYSRYLWHEGVRNQINKMMLGQEEPLKPEPSRFAGDIHLSILDPAVGAATR